MPWKSARPSKYCPETTVNDVRSLFPLQFIAALVLSLAGPVAAASVDQPLRQHVFDLSASSDVVGEVQTVTAREEDTLLDIGRDNRYGYDAVRAANPQVDAWVPGEGTEVTLPGQHILPAAPRKGIVINVSEKRLYYYPAKGSGKQVEIYAISVGRGDWSTPLEVTEVTGMVKDPTWFPPASIRAEHEAKGDPLPRQVPPGPDNPLGRYILRLGIPSYFIHGTNRENGIGMQVTHGCIRMFPSDIEHLAHTVPRGTPVYIVNQRYKAGWKGGVLYLEVHPPLDGAGGAEDTTSRSITATLSEVKKTFPEAVIDWSEVWRVQEMQSGLPTPVGHLL